ncbi:MAG TPA: HAD-IB family hydrolase [Woeseiaceae bacterium]|nr:HAD-IB family hydrolase [Woeseiaceae bacterium]
MPTEPYARVTRRVRDGVGGRSVGALFDLDGTIIAGHSVGDFFVERLKAGQVGVDEFRDLLTMSARYLMKSGDFEDGMAASVANLRGQPEDELIRLGQRVGRERLLGQVFPEMKALLRAHRERGHTIAIVTSATRYQAQPLADYLGVDHVLCTELGVTGGRFTGTIRGEPCYGANKLTAARAFARRHKVSLAKSYFYSNGSEDLPLLQAVGSPVVVNPDRRLRPAAERQGWPVHDFASRGSVGPLDVARTITTFGSILPTFAAGLPLRLLGASRRDALNFSLAAWTTLAPLIARLRLIVEGEEHLWSDRPAVFVFNHRSAIDVLIVARLLREDIVGVAKKEVQRQPFLGPALSFAGTVFVDRDNAGDPKKALEPAVAALGEGRSVAIAPEGTRSRDGRLGEFKRGALHLARQARVPIVPIVIHNAPDALPNGGLVVRPAEVKVTVLPPVATEDWTLRSIAPQARRIRQLFLRELGQWEARED